MHNNETKDKFVELRAAGQSFGRISEQLGVAKSTLHHWQDERGDDIARLRRIQWEEWETEASCRIEDRLEDPVCSIADYELRLGHFKLGQLSLRDTVMLLRESRREYFRLRAILMGTPSRSRRSGASEKPNETERFTQNEPARPLITNDLQPSKSESFDSCAGRDAAASPSVCTSEISNVRSEIDSTQASVPAVSSVVKPASEKPNKTERFTENEPTRPLITNDLQQPKPESFDSAVPSDSTIQRFDLTI